MEDEIVLTEDLRQILEKAREEYRDLEDLDLLKTNKDELQTYFRHADVLKGLISSIESYLDENKLPR